jgi:hypothetical protein
MKFLNFSLYLSTILTCLYPDPDPLTQLNPDPIQIRIEVAIGNRLRIAIKCGIRIRTVLLQVTIRNTVLIQYCLCLSYVRSSDRTCTKEIKKNLLSLAWEEI